MRSDPGARLWFLLVSCSALICSSVSCAVGTANATIIDEYKEASCLPPSVVRGVQPPTRGWHSSLSFDTGQIVVKGAQMVAGRIEVQDSTSNRKIIAADPGDYIY